MAEPAEQISNFELLSPREADKYLQAACMVLGVENNTRIEGVEVLGSIDPKTEDFRSGYLNIDIDGHTGYRVRGMKLGRRDFLSIGQIDLDDLEPGVAISGAPDINTIVRLGAMDSKRGTYRTIRASKTAGRLLTISYVARTQEEKDQAAAVFATMASALKADLTPKLEAVRPELIDDIEKTADRLHQGRQKGWAPRTLGRWATLRQLAP